MAEPGQPGSVVDNDSICCAHGGGSHTVKTVKRRNQYITIRFCKACQKEGAVDYIHSHRRGRI